MQEAPQFREVSPKTKLIAGGVATIIAGVASYFVIDHFGTQLHLGVQDVPTKLIESTGVGLWAGLSTVGIAAEVRLSPKSSQSLRRTGPLTPKHS